MTIDEKKQRKEEIIASTDMFDVLAQYGVEVKRRMCCCIFHKEKNPSMKVFKDGVQCFVCNQNWNIFDVVMELNGCDFNTAFDLLGGNNKPSWKSYVTASRNRSKRKSEKAFLDYKHRKIKEQQEKVLSLRSVIREETPYSDDWCKNQNKLIYEEYILDQLISEVSR
jgi:DNA primase